jgi:hypothetical protein
MTRMNRRTMTSMSLADTLSDYNIKSANWYLMESRTKFIG